VQRSNPEMERRAQEVINTCISLGEANPILAIHDVGAGGLSNAVPELVDLSGLGGHINLRHIHLAETGLSPAEIWCNESQERYVLAVSPEQFPLFQEICQRERSLFCVLGYIIDHDQAAQKAILKLEDAQSQTKETQYPVHLPMDVLLGNTPKLLKKATTKPTPDLHFNLDNLDLGHQLEAILAHPTVASKQFLITIGDRTVGGLTHRDQMVGPWQTPVADCAVTMASYDDVKGEAMSMGERTPLAIYNSAAAARMAVGEALTNLWAADVADLKQIKLSANWMAACTNPEDGEDGEDAKLYEAVQAIGLELCPALGLSIPVGKDSLSMRSAWVDENTQENKCVKSPVSLIISAFAVIEDVSKTLTPMPHVYSNLKNIQNEQTTLEKDSENHSTNNMDDQELILIDLGHGKQRLGGSILAQIHQAHAITPDLDDVNAFKNTFLALQDLRKAGAILAYHDRSDGGLWASVCEMAFAGRCGFALNLDIITLNNDESDDWGDAKDWRKQTTGRRQNKVLSTLANEELGIVLQIKKSQRNQVFDILNKHGLSKDTHFIGYFTKEENCTLLLDGQIVYQKTRADLQNIWSHVSKSIALLRDHPELVANEYQKVSQAASENPGLHIIWPHAAPTSAPHAFSNNPIHLAIQKPKIAILREQGVNSHIEMAYALELAGFECYDVHMSDLIASRQHLKNMQGLIACGGFSYGDVLGAGQGWAKTILYHPQLAEQFAEFFQNPQKFALGICNGSQMLSHLAPIIPGAHNWPTFTRNLSEQYEARLSLVEVQKNQSIFLNNMVGAVLPVVVAHGEGFANFSDPAKINQLNAENGATLRFVDGNCQIAQSTNYPDNPNGSPEGITAVVNQDGRIMAMMPHPERSIKTLQLSYAGNYNAEFTPWLEMMHNAYNWSKHN
jgi:phosphoribosylformylglycinamidine synthase